MLYITAKKISLLENLISFELTNYQLSEAMEKYSDKSLFLQGADNVAEAMWRHADV